MPVWAVVAKGGVSTVGSLFGPVGHLFWFKHILFHLIDQSLTIIDHCFCYLFSWSPSVPYRLLARCLLNNFSWPPPGHHWPHLPVTMSCKTSCDHPLAITDHISLWQCHAKLLVTTPWPSLTTSPCDNVMQNFLWPPPGHHWPHLPVTMSSKTSCDHPSGHHWPPLP